MLFAEHPPYFKNRDFDARDCTSMTFIPIFSLDNIETKFLVAQSAHIGSLTHRLTYLRLCCLTHPAPIINSKLNVKMQ